ncbi:TonB-dependent receptor [Acinetobacter populi]|uniref:TonB-dependent siderophore receptor n=1 Tax=Acinetobacter populi TaxID=1582270 RepID=A0A1Z9YVM6_9GAMM|nr:TonB-dependent siderophore receptor [Acinetobacter populi]OUY06260.1 TonB-dependent siderophore receptor [Acinetobacter populi]
MQNIFAEETSVNITKNNSTHTVVLPTIVIEAMDDGDPIKTYVDYKQANVTRNGLDKKDIPQTIDTIDVSKYKIYGANDLSVMLQGTPGIDTSYDTRGDGISIRGFSADTGDIYRDGNRESGQVRRSTANVERIEILKGPASVLYGRGGGGGVINMVTKFANFDSKSSIGAYIGSYNNIGEVFDFNNTINDNWAVRLTGEYGDTNSFRKGIGTKTEMISPSITYRNDDQTLTWTTQYTYDKINRVPDRGPSFENMPDGTSIKMGYAQKDDYIYDQLQVFRTDLKYDFNDNWKIHFAASDRSAYQNFDHFYGGSLCTSTVEPNPNGTTTAAKQGCYEGYIRQTYYWQQTENSTRAGSLELEGNFNTGFLKHQLITGIDYSYEQREPLLSNVNADGSTIYGFVNPLTGDRFSNRGQGHVITTHNYNEATSYGIFMQDLISIVPEVKVMLGVRYDDMEYSTTNKLLDASNANYKRTVKDDRVNPNAGIVWQPVEDHSFYASFSRSFAPFGGNSGVSVVSASQNLDIMNTDPQYNDQYEIGMKSDWFNQQFTTYLSLFDISKHNIRYRPDAENDPYNWTVAGKHQSKGIELSFTGKVFDDFYIRGGYGYKDAKIKEDKATPANEGKQFSGSSKHTGNLFLRYLATDKIYGEIGATYVGSYYTDTANTTKRDGWTRLDTAFGYKDDKWGATFAINNLTNKEYWRSSSMPGTPRNYLFRVNYYF